jgi:hypothetical protein
MEYPLIYPNERISNMPVKIIGGRSAHRQISFLSTEFSVTAICNQDNTITCKVKPLPCMVSFLYRHKRLPLPGIIRLLLVMFAGAKVKGRIVLGLMFLSLFLSAWVEIQLIPPKMAVPQLISPWFFGGLMLLLAWLIFWLLPRGLRRVATWHAAEHMTIAAYDKSGAADLEVIAVQDRVHPKCGGRLALPFLASGLLVLLFAFKAPANWFLVSVMLGDLALLEAVLLIDRLIGWDRIPVAAQTSRLLQRYVTTRQPGELELRTAQRAMLELISTPHSYSNSSARSAVNGV